MSQLESVIPSYAYFQQITYKYIILTGLHLPEGP